MSRALLNALRLALPLAEQQAQRVRSMARALAANNAIPTDAAAVAAEHADRASHAVTAARLALDGDMYAVTLAVHIAGDPLRHVVHVWARDPEEAQECALEVCEAAGLQHGNIYTIALA